MFGTYGEDLSFIHDAGFGGVARRAAEALAPALGPASRVVDLGCGSGILAAALSEAGHAVLGLDASPAMVALARRNAPGARFEAASWREAPLPPCDAVVATGEVFNYLFDGDPGLEGLEAVFRRIREALAPGGLLAFDAAGPGRVPASGAYRREVRGEGWTVGVEAQLEGGVLVRRITTRRLAGGAWREDEEVHRQRLLDPRDLAAGLRGLGFRVRLRKGWGPEPLGPGMRVIWARKA